LEQVVAEVETNMTDMVAKNMEPDEIARVRIQIAQEACETHRRTLNDAREKLKCQRVKVDQWNDSEKYVDALLSRARTCGVCGVQKCEVMTTCVHCFCAGCADAHIRSTGVCPSCNVKCTEDDVVVIAEVGGIGTKMREIGTHILTFSGEPVVLFVQWKTMMRPMRAFLRSIGARVLLLDGNAVQRASTRSEFLNGGVLLLCLEDSFAGLHLPHVRTILFAHAIVGDRERVAHLERQAIARCARRGQVAENVNVFSFVVAQCEEEELWHNTHDT